MKVTLTQFRGDRLLRQSILIRLENRDLCTEIQTSSTFAPYRELFVWLGQIRDAQIPDSMIIDEEGQGVELIVKKLDNGLLHFYVDPWMCCNDRATRFSETLSRQELVEAFCHGIVEFINSENRPLEGVFVNDLSNLNWQTLLDPTIVPSHNWKMRLALYGGARGRVNATGRNNIEQYLTTEQQWLMVLYDALFTVALHMYYGEAEESYTLVNLYQNAIVDFMLNELDPDWYEKRRIEIDREFKSRTEIASKRGIKRGLQYKRLQSRARLATLEVGQLVDGRIYGIRSYGAIVDIGGYYALLTTSAISQLPIECPSQVFQVKDWVRAIVVWMDVEKGRVSLSTSDLEPEPGDMLRNPLSVYEQATEMAERYRQNVLSNLITE